MYLSEHLLLKKNQGRISYYFIVEIGYLEKDSTFGDISRFPDANTCEEILMIRIDSSLHFANISFLEEKINVFYSIKPTIKWIIMEMSGVNDIDTYVLDRIIGDMII